MLYSYHVGKYLGIIIQSKSYFSYSSDLWAKSQWSIVELFSNVPTLGNFILIIFEKLNTSPKLSQKYCVFWISNSSQCWEMYYKTNFIKIVNVPNMGIFFIINLIHKHHCFIWVTPQLAPIFNQGDLKFRFFSISGIFAGIVRNEES